MIYLRLSSLFRFVQFIVHTVKRFRVEKVTFFLKKSGNIFGDWKQTSWKFFRPPARVPILEFGAETSLRFPCVIQGDRRVMSSDDVLTYVWTCPRRRLETLERVRTPAAAQRDARTTATRHGVSERRVSTRRRTAAGIDIYTTPAKLPARSHTDASERFRAVSGAHTCRNCPRFVLGPPGRVKRVLVEGLPANSVEIQRLEVRHVSALIDPVLGTDMPAGNTPADACLPACPPGTRTPPGHRCSTISDDESVTQYTHRTARGAHRARNPKRGRGE